MTYLQLMPFIYNTSSFIQLEYNREAETEKNTQLYN